MVLLGEKFITVSARDYAIAVHVDREVETDSQFMDTRSSANGDEYAELENFNYRCFYSTTEYEMELTEVFHCQMFFSYPVEGLLKVFIGFAADGAVRDEQQARYLKNMHTAILYLEQSFTITQSQLDCSKMVITIS